MSVTDIAKNPLNYFKVIDDDVLVHGTSILQYAKDAVAAYEKKDMVMYGTKLGEILKIATDGKKAF